MIHEQKRNRNSGVRHLRSRSQSRGYLTGEKAISPFDVRGGGIGTDAKHGVVLLLRRTRWWWHHHWTPPPVPLVLTSTSTWRRCNWIKEEEETTTTAAAASASVDDGRQFNFYFIYYYFFFFGCVELESDIITYSSMFNRVIMWLEGSCWIFF